MSLPGLAMILPFYDARCTCIINHFVKLRQVKPLNKVYREFASEVKVADNGAFSNF